ncbi:indolepyruvate ferredoxin oxidoreductase family protein [Porticoccus sp. GXU_MW_L64]
MSKDPKKVSLDDKYTQNGRVYLTGTQALVRLPMMQRELDQKNGLKTGCFISGYRGSPLGGLDLQLLKAEDFLKKNDVVFQPGVNEEMAATAVWGSQQVGLRDESEFDGVFGIWYAKGPGVDRTGDAFRHANLSGTSPNGGVIALLGDDHTCESSTTCHQSEFAMVDAMMPTLNPAGVEEIVEYGLHGWAMSRYSGCWVGIKCVHDTVSSTVSADLSLDKFNSVIPEDFELPEDGVNIRLGDMPRPQEVRLHRYKLKAAQAYCRANKLDRVVMDSSNAKLGIVTTGKSYLDVRQALSDLGIDEARAEQLGLRVYKVGMVWPLEQQMAKQVCQGLETVLVVEEKRNLIEHQLKDAFYGQDDAPMIIGKSDEQGNELLRSILDLNSNIVASTIAEAILAKVDDAELKNRLADIHQLEAREEPQASMKRTFYFCAGCPHSSSTKLPEGSRGMAGIGCAWMSQFMDRNVDGYSQMGGEGGTWIGEAPFSGTDHIFQNLGDGTYFHSGNMAIRSTVAAGTNITFKILYNDAVAMTGGQPHDGTLNPHSIAWQVYSEGVKAVKVVTDEPHKYQNINWPPGTKVYHRRDLNAVQRELRGIPGTTVLIYDQTCAAEKRRRRKRKLYPDPAKRLFINSKICEGCGDCGVASNCTAILPKETELGRKREIDQSACNKDYSCVNGFCPSFVTVLGGSLKKAEAEEQITMMPPEPAVASLNQGYSVVITGVGGTGVVTVGALLGMAAHIEGKGFAVLDMTGLAQKGGAVMSHLRLAPTSQDIGTIRIASGGADLVLGCDSVVTAGGEALETMRKDKTQVLVNSQEVMPGDFTRNADLEFPAEELQSLLENWVGKEQVEFIASTDMAVKYLGNSIGGNLLMLGYAYQKGLIPLSADSINQAIEINGAAVSMNQQAFLLGRQLAAGMINADKLSSTEKNLAFDSDDRNAIVAHRSEFLVDYQDEAYAHRYRALVEQVANKEAELGIGLQALSTAVAKYYFKLLAYKDEYEVARLYSSPEFMQNLKGTFTGDVKLKFNLAPPLISKRDKVTGNLIKREFGSWMLSAFKLLAPLKKLRGTALDVFGYTAERKMERQLIADYEAMLENILGKLTAANYDTAVALAELPEQVRGFGHVKEDHIARMRAEKSRLQTQFAMADQIVKVA